MLTCGFFLSNFPLAARIENGRIRVLDTVGERTKIEALEINEVDERDGLVRIETDDMDDGAIADVSFDEVAVDVVAAAAAAATDIDI